MRVLGVKVKKIIEGNVFCGYYDLHPLSKDNRFILLHKAKFNDREVQANDYVEIVIYDLEKDIGEVIDQTLAWNWQQGSRLQWVGLELNRYIAYNSFDVNNGILHGVIYDSYEKKSTKIDMPIYSISSCGNVVISYDFNRMYKARKAYSYAVCESSSGEVVNNKGVGISVYDINKKTKNNIVLIEDLIAFKPETSMDFGCHWVDSPIFREGDSEIIFLHRWIKSDGFYSRLYAVNIDGSNLRLLNDSGVVNHIDTRGNHVLFDGFGSNSVNSIRKYSFVSKSFKYLLPFYHMLANRMPKVRSRLLTHYYYLTNIDSGEEIAILKSLPSVAHPSLSPLADGQFLSDTYEMKDLHRYLYLCNTKTNKYILLLKQYSPKEYNGTEYRCDLHPKWSIDGGKYTVDFIENSERKVLVSDF